MATQHKVFLSELDNFPQELSSKLTKINFCQYYANKHTYKSICDALRDVVPFAQFRKRE